MSAYIDKLRKHIQDQKIDATVYTFKSSTHSVSEAATAVGANPEDFVKSICLIGPDSELIVAIVKGEDRVDLKKVSKALGIETPRIAQKEEMYEKTGYPVGGTPAFGYDAVFLMDPKVLEKDSVYSGGGSTTALTYMSTEEMRRVNGAKITQLRS